MKTYSSKTHYFFVAALIALWGIGFIFGTAVGSNLKLYDRTIQLLTLLSVLMLVKLNGIIKRIGVVLITYVCIYSVYTSFFFDRTILSYSCVYLLVFLIANQSITEGDLKLVGCAYGILSAFVLIVANYTSILSGWDGNSISMGAFYGYVLFVATNYNLKNKKSFRLLIAYSCIYFMWMSTSVLNSRSSMLCSVILLLSVFRIIPMKKALENNRLRLILWITPLLIAIFVVCIRNHPFIGTLNIWSYTKFNKPLFNGRDVIWSYGFDVLWDHFLFGRGTFEGNWHNSAVTCLVGAGVIGYVIWIFSLNRIYKSAKYYLDDPYVLGLASAFMVIWLQQSLDLGLIQKQAQIPPFVILGLLCARINMLRRECCEVQAFNHSSDI